MARVRQFINTTPLAANATYTGPAVDGLNARRLTGYAHASHAGNLYFEHSDDGQTWHRSGATAVAAETLVKYDETFAARFARPVYINGATAQTGFRINGYLGEV